MQKIAFGASSATALLAALLAASPAMAADLGAGGSKDEPYAYSAPDVKWTGFYFGSVSGWGSYNHKLSGVRTYNETDANNVITFSSATDATLTSLGAGGGLFGLNAGYDAQLPNSRLVVGLWGEYNWATGKTSGSVDYSNSNNVDKTALFTLQHDDEWSLGGRAGYLVNNSTLVYGLAAFTHYDATLSGTGIDAAHGWQHDAGASGYTLGLGYEAMFASTSAGYFSYKLEGRYFTGGETTLLDKAATGKCCEGGNWVSNTTLTDKVDAYSVMVGLNWRPRLSNMPLGDTYK